MNETETRLRQLRDLSRDKSLSLALAEATEAVRLLRELLVAGNSAADFDLTVELSTQLPPEVVAQSLLEAWASLDEARRAEIVAWQRKSIAQKIPPFRRLALLLTRGLIKAEPLTARQLLAAICRTMSANDARDPDARDAQNFRTVLINDPEWSLASLDLMGMPSVERGPLIRCAFTAAFTQAGAKKPIQAEVQIRTAHWLLDGQKLEWMTLARQEVFLQAASGWPPESRKEVAGLLGALPEVQEKLARPPVRPVVQLRPAPDDAATPPPPADDEPAAGAEPASNPLAESEPNLSMESVAVASPVPPAVTAGVQPELKSEARPELPRRPEKTPVSAGWRGLLKAMEESFGRLEASSRQEAERARQVGKDLQVACVRNAELERRRTDDLADLQTKTRELAAARTSLEESQSALAEARVDLDETRAALGRERDRAGAALEKVEALTARLDEEAARHQADAERLTHRIGTEGERQTEAYRNKLAARLRIEHDDFLSVADAPPTAETAASLRHLLQGVFEALAREGVKIAG